MKFFKKVFIKKQENRRGFTLIETFVAITILMIVVLGPMSLLSNALRDARIIGNEITAAYLAQEGVELIINYRNNNPAGAMDSLVSGINSSYYFDNTMAVPRSCGGGACPILTISPTNGYQYNLASSPSIFSRTIQIRRILPNQYLITSSVSWQGSPRPPIVSSSIIFKKS